MVKEKAVRKIRRSYQDFKPRSHDFKSVTLANAPMEPGSAQKPWNDTDKRVVSFLLYWCKMSVNKKLNKVNTCVIWFTERHIPVREWTLHRFILPV